MLALPFLGSGYGAKVMTKHILMTLMFWVLGKIRVAIAAANSRHGTTMIVTGSTGSWFLLAVSNS